MHSWMRNRKPQAHNLHFNPTNLTTEYKGEAHGIDIDFEILAV